jgi:phage head maturation protease
MMLTVDSEGMEIKVNLDTENNSEARALYSAVERNDITGMSFMFSVRDEKWEDIDSEHPTRRITQIGTVVEVSAVTFPAYQSTEIYARSKEAVETALNTLESVRQQRAQSLESDTKCDELELAKAKYEFKSKS